MNTVLEKYLENVRKDLEEIANGTTQETNDDGEQMTLYDYFNDALDIEYTVNSRGDYISARIYITIGGPNVWIDTRYSIIAGAWGFDREQLYLNDDITKEINAIFEEYYSMTRQ